MMSSATDADRIAMTRRQIDDHGYAPRVYAALLGKVIGVYAGRPFEGWTYDRITNRFGEVDRYVAAELGKHLIVTDDDIAGTMTFIRAAADSGRGYQTTSDDVAEGWLNHLIEGRSVLWWGGMGNSTEHTAYLRLKAGYRPPVSGSAALNGQVVSEQIGSQIFIDGWGLISPGNPELAAELARRAAVVSHDGEAIFGAQMIAAMEAAAFVLDDIDEIIDAGLAQIPADSLIATLVADLRGWHAIEPDWRITRQRLDDEYGYHLYGGGCHIVPNFGVIILTLLYCERQFGRAMTIVNTAGWDTDCNAGNVGCLLGLIAGLDSMQDGYDWRGPVADRIYVPTADAGGGITDVVTETRRIVAIARSAAGIDDGVDPAPRFSFDFEGSVQGFGVIGEGFLRNEPLPSAVRLSLGTGSTATDGRGLRIHVDGTAQVTTPTFVPPEARHMASYPLDASPTIYSGQTLTFGYEVDDVGEQGRDTDVLVTPLLRAYDGDDATVTLFGEAQTARVGTNRVTWVVPQLDGRPIHEIGLVVENSRGRFFLASAQWGGTPGVDLIRPAGHGEMWRRAWVSETEFEHPDPEGGLRLISNGERRLAMTGTQEWTDYSVEAAVTPHAAEAVGLAARVQGLRRYYLLRLAADGEAQLIRRRGADDRILARAPQAWSPGQKRHFRIDAFGDTITAYLDGMRVGTVTDPADGLDRGGIAIACEGGRVDCSEVRVDATSMS